MWIQDNFNKIMIGGIALIMGLTFMGARQTHKEIKKGKVEWVLWKTKNNKDTLR